MEIATYSRISTDKQDNQNQLGQLRRFAARQGWKTKSECVDVATGKNSDREQFKALFKAASRREFTLVLFWSLDRFSREGVPVANKLARIAWAVLAKGQDYRAGAVVATV